MAYLSVFHLLSDIFKKTGVSAILVEGFAVNHYGYARQTADVDFLIGVNDLSKIKTLLEIEGYKEISSQKMFSRFRSDKGDFIDIDLLFADGNTMAKMLKAGRKIDISGQKFTVPALLHLIAMKAHAIRNNPGLAERIDMQDIINLVKINNIDVKSKDFKEVCLKFGTEDIYKQILDILGER